MKKFILGFVSGALLFSSVTVFAAVNKFDYTTITKFSINGKKHDKKVALSESPIVVMKDGKKTSKVFLSEYLLNELGYTQSYNKDVLSIQYKEQFSKINIDGLEISGSKLTNKPIIMNGVTYFPSSLLPELGFTPSRSEDKKGVVLMSNGTVMYPKFVNKEDDILQPEIKSEGSTLSESFVGTENPVKDSKGTSYSNFIYTNFFESNSNNSASFTFTVNNHFRRFTTTAGFIEKNHGKNNDPISLSIVLTYLDGRQPKTYNYEFNEKQTVLPKELNFALRQVAKVQIVIKSTSKLPQEFALLNARFI